MAGFFSRLFDPPQRPSFFGPQQTGDNATSGDGSPDAPARPFFELDPMLWGAKDPQELLVSAAGMPPSRTPTGYGRAVPVVADFGRRGRADLPFWHTPLGFPNADPRMPFFILPPNAIFNMPIVTHLPGTPYVGKDGLPHLEGWNPYEGKVVSPGRGI